MKNMYAFARGHERRPDWGRAFDCLRPLRPHPGAARRHIQVDGVELNYLTMQPAEIFWRMLQYNEFQASRDVAVEHDDA